jgi:cytoskeleton protein RodZ
MSKPAPFTKLPDSMELEDIGPYFRSLREHYNLSEQDVSSRLHIRVKYIQAIETSDMTQLPGKVYARGYIATYAEFLGIDPENAVERFLGTETKPKAEEYFVPEPARLGIGLQQKLRLGAVIIVGIALVYALFGMSSSERDDSMVVPVPESLVESSRSLVMPVDGSLRCVEGSILAACVHGNRVAPDNHPLNRPDVFIAATPWKPAAEKKPETVKETPPPEKKKEEKPVKVTKPKEETPEEQVLPWLKKKPE